MTTTIKKYAAIFCLGAVLSGSNFVHAQDVATTQNSGRTTAGTDDAGIVTGDAAARAGNATTMQADSGMKMGSTMQSGSGMAMGSGMMDAKSKNAQMLIQTLSEEKTEINALAAQQAALKQMGGRENLALAAMWGRWIAEHKAAGPA